MGAFVVGFLLLSWVGGALSPLVVLWLVYARCYAVAVGLVTLLAYPYLAPMPSRSASSLQPPSNSATHQDLQNPGLQVLLLAVDVYCARLITFAFSSCPLPPLPCVSFIVPPKPTSSFNLWLGGLGLGGVREP